MNRIVILTLTYNRPENLKHLFETLQQQSDKDFIWMIVDDGSPQDLQPLISEMKSKAEYRIDYYRKENGGKSAAINFALDRLNADDFVLIIDDDEFLYPDAIEKAKKKMAEYEDSDVGLINFNRYDKDGKILAKPYIAEDFRMSLQEHSKLGYYAGGYVGYYMSKIGRKRFPIYEGEKYIAPSVLMMLVGQSSSILWSPVALGYTEFLEGGLTMRGRKLRLVSPRSMATHSLLVLSGDCGIKNRLNSSILYYAYLHYQRIDEFEFSQCKKNIFLSFVTKPVGILLSKCWYNKYKKSCQNSRA